MAGVSRKTEVLLNIFVCLGASVVIFGTMAKILHLSWADMALKVGLTTEALIFLVYAFIPPPSSDHGAAAPTVVATGNPALQSLDKMLQEADITPTNLQKLSAGFSKLGSSVDKLGEIGDVVKATGDFSASAKSATAAFNQIQESVGKSAIALNGIAAASTAIQASVEDAKKAQEQFAALGKNLSSLNTVYGNMLSAMQVRG